MIQKIAEVFVLRRQFPLGGLYTREEMSLEENDNGNRANMDVPMKSNPAPNKQDVVAGNQQTAEASVQQTNDNNVEGSFILQSFEKGVSPQNVPFAKLNVLDKATNEVSLVLVKGKEDVIESLSHVQMGQELALVIKKENGFNFLESYSYVQGNDQSVQSETQLQSSKENPFKRLYHRKTKRLLNHLMHSSWKSMNRVKLPLAYLLQRCT